jgi:exodeoxyribonuclease V beta subunit
MGEHLYYLQYLIYSLALDGYLALRIPDYDYETHFGGVFYVFLRGLTSGPDPDAGIFRDHPDVSLIEILKEKLIPRPGFPGNHKEK